MTTFRPVPESDRGRYSEILRYAFAPQQGPVEPDESDDSEWPPTLFDPRGLYRDGTLVSTCKLYHLDARIREGYERIGGLGAVATPPEHRRRGFVRELCRQALSEFGTAGATLVALWPFETSFYANLGWASANRLSRYECPPAALPRYETGGRMRPLDPDDWERLRNAENAHGEGVALSLRRSEQWWRERTLTNWTGGTEPFIYGYERDGEIAGFLTYTVADDERETLTVDLLVAADEDAFRAIVSFLGTHGAQIERVVFTRPEGSELLDRVSDPERVDCTIQPGPMVRLPDLWALEAISWPSGAVECTIAVSDPLIEDNEGVYRLAIREGSATVEESDTERSAADIALDIGTLSQFVVGSRSLEHAERLGDVDVHDRERANRLVSICSPQQVCLGEYF